jgi:hypothetical protein
VWRPALQRGEEQPGDDNGESAEPDNHLIDPAFEVRKPHVEPLLQLSQIGLGRDVVMDRVVPLGYASDGHTVLSPGVGRDALCVVASETGAFKGTGQGQAIGHRLIPARTRMKSQGLSNIHFAGLLPSRFVVIKRSSACRLLQLDQGAAEILWM